MDLSIYASPEALPSERWLIVLLMVAVLSTIYILARLMWAFILARLHHEPRGAGSHKIFLIGTIILFLAIHVLGYISFNARYALLRVAIDKYASKGGSNWLANIALNGMAGTAAIIWASSFCAAVLVILTLCLYKHQKKAA